MKEEDIKDCVAVVQRRRRERKEEWKAEEGEVFSHHTEWHGRRNGRGVRVWEYVCLVLWVQAGRC